MDVTYLTTPGAYFHFATPLSPCSEPILQLPMPDGRFGPPGQQKPPKVQLLNKTITNAQKKKTMVRGSQLPSLIEPLDMMNFFQTLVPFSESSPRESKWKYQGRLSKSPPPPPPPVPKQKQLVHIFITETAFSVHTGCLS